MKSIALAVVMALLFVNVIAYPYWTATDDDDEWRPGTGDDPDDIVPIDSISVTVPPIKSGDIFQYDYVFFAEIYDKNTSSGNWSRITLEANGQMLEQMDGPLTQKDGYQVNHETWRMHTELSLTVRITVIEYSPGEDNEPLIINGRITVNRDVYATLKGDIPIMNYAGGLLAVDEVKGLDLPVANFEFDAENWGYPDPHDVPDRQLEEQIYGDGNKLDESMNGTYGEFDPAWNYTQWYNWSIDRSERVRSWDCVRLNISLDFFGFITLDKLLWLSSDVPRPVRVMYNSSTSWFERNSTGHLILKTEQTLTKNGYTKGGAVIPINRLATETFVERSPTGDFRAWEFAPQDGSVSSSSFDLGFEEAVDLCFAQDEGLREWQRTHPSPMVTEAAYWANQTDQRTREYTWNMTFSDEPKDFSNWEDWYPTNSYQINVTRRVTTRVIGGDEVETFVAGTPRAWYGYARVPENDISDQLLTLSSSEDLWASVNRVASEAYSGTSGKVDFTDARYFFSHGGIDFAGGFGLDLLDTLAGISVPNNNITYTLQVGNVWEGANTFTASVDAETGRIVNIMKVEGPQSLSFILGNL